MRRVLFKRVLVCLVVAAVSIVRSAAQLEASDPLSVEDAERLLIREGFANIRTLEEESRLVFTLECDSYKLPSEGFAVARKIVERIAGSSEMELKIIGLDRGIPQVTMTRDKGAESWHTTRKLDSGWDEVKKLKPKESLTGKVDIVVYPQVSLMNLIINQVYQSLWQLSPALEVSLWKGMKFSYQVKIPVFNDGYGDLESKVHPGIVSLSQSFRDPWKLNLQGKVTIGAFAGNRYGAALEASWYLPGDQVWFDTQLGLISNYYWEGFYFKFSRDFYFRWNAAVNYYCPPLHTQFTLRAQQFLIGDIGLKYEMIRHFSRCSVGLYAEKSKGVDMNVGFRFQISLPPYRHARRGYIPRITVSDQMGMSYNANNEKFYYREWRTEASDNIMSRNYFNPFHLDGDK